MQTLSVLDVFRRYDKKFDHDQLESKAFIM